MTAGRMSRTEGPVLYDRETEPGAELRYTESRAPEELAPLIRAVWHLQDRVGGDDEAQPVVPDGCMELVFNLADPFLRVTRGGLVERQSTQLLVGQMTEATMLRPSGRVDVWGVRLRPWAGAALLGISASAVRGHIVSVDALDGSTGAGLAEWLPRLAAAPARARERLLLTLLSGLAAQARAPGPAVAPLVRQVLDGPDTLTVAGIAARAGLGTRRVQMLFAEHVGLAPKLLFRIARFQRALAFARARPPRSWAAVALSAGYHDQSHFIRDCREFASCTPSRLRAAGHDLTDSFLGE